jgi:antitoxin ParD1/3/4
MTVELKPETEALIHKRIESGAFSSPAEVIERALEFLNVEEDWLAETRNEIAAGIQEGWDKAQRGDLVDGKQVRGEMQKFKSEWIRQL